MRNAQQTGSRRWHPLIVRWTRTAKTNLDGALRDLGRLALTVRWACRCALALVRRIRPFAVRLRRIGGVILRTASDWLRPIVARLGPMGKALGRGAGRFRCIANSWLGLRAQPSSAVPSRARLVLSRWLSGTACGAVAAALVLQTGGTKADALVYLKVAQDNCPGPKFCDLVKQTIAKLEKQ